MEERFSQYKIKYEREADDAKENHYCPQKHFLQVKGCEDLS